MISEFLWINIPLMALFFALWVGVPMWMIFKRPDRDPRETRTIPAYLRKSATAGMPARRALTSEDAERRELVGASRSLQRGEPGSLR
ncbi:MAG: hypothetical protein WB688_00965 [Trebonia sp.]